MGAYDEKLEAFLEQLTNAELGYADELVFNGKPLRCIGPGKEFYRKMKATNYLEQVPAKFQMLREEFESNKMTYLSEFYSSGRKFQIHTYDLDRNEPSVIISAMLR